MHRFQVAAMHTPSASSRHDSIRSQLDTVLSKHAALDQERMKTIDSLMGFDGGLVLNQYTQRAKSATSLLQEAFEGVPHAIEAVEALYGLYCENRTRIKDQSLITQSSRRRRAEKILKASVAPFRPAPSVIRRLQQDSDMGFLSAKRIVNDITTYELARCLAEYAQTKPHSYSNATMAVVLDQLTTSEGSSNAKVADHSTFEGYVEARLGPDVYNTIEDVLRVYREQAKLW